MRCQALRSLSAIVPKVNPPAILISASIAPKWAATALIAFCLCRIDQVDAAEFNLLGCCRELRRSMIDTSHSRALRKGFLGDHLAKGAKRTGDFTLHVVSA